MSHSSYKVANKSHQLYFKCKTLHSLWSKFAFCWSSNCFSISSHALHIAFLLRQLTCQYKCNQLNSFWFMAWKIQQIWVWNSRLQRNEFIDVRLDGCVKTSAIVKKVLWKLITLNILDLLNAEWWKKYSNIIFKWKCSLCVKILLN